MADAQFQGTSSFCLLVFRFVPQFLLLNDTHMLKVQVQRHCTSLKGRSLVPGSLTGKEASDFPEKISMGSAPFYEFSLADLVKVSSLFF